MKIRIIGFLIAVTLSFFNSLSVQKNDESSDNRFKIVFVADPRVVNNKDWLNKITEDWGATGICIRIFWGHVDTDSIPGADNWLNLDNALNNLVSLEGKNLDIYLRICMGLQKPVWVSPDNKRFIHDDFQIKYDKSIYDHQMYEKGIPESERYPLNFNSPNSQKYMKEFLREVLVHIDNSLPDSIKSRIKEIVPTFSTSDEAEYPFSAMCGYSSYEREEFINFLKSKYFKSLKSLNNKWNPENNFSDFNSWSKISPEKYEWHTYDNSDYKYPNGRVDWINFRTRQLVSFINSLSDLIASFNFQVGVQIGSIYDDLIERRGWADPTMLFERADAVHVADIYQYSENFDFGAEYLSSICKFWTQTNKLYYRPVRFSTETNWPNFNNRDAEFLSFYWKEQLISYYNRGASEHYVVGWDVTQKELDRLKSLYNSWRKVLLRYSNRELATKSTDLGLHLGIEQVFYNHNEKSFWSKTFALKNSLTAHYESISTEYSYKRDKDIITNYMFERNPHYLNNYKLVHFDKINGYITEEAYLKLSKYLVEKEITKSSFVETDSTEGLFIRYNNEYNEAYMSIPITIRIE